MTPEEFTRLFDKSHGKNEIKKQARECLGAIYSLSNHKNRPTYIIELKDGVTEGDITYLNSGLRDLGVIAFFIPEGLIKVTGRIVPSE